MLSVNTEDHLLVKNVYIFYPPGYSGSYINWAINAADKDQSLHTVDNPVNKSVSLKLGGIGTSHLHTRLPTHQGIEAQLIWILYNKPTDHRVYIINSSTKETRRGIYLVSRYDPNGIFINVHNDNSSTVDSYCLINCVTKWPVFLEVMISDQQLLTGQNVGIHDQFDPYNCVNDRIFRNWAVKDESHLFKHNLKLDHAKLETSVLGYKNWYSIRNRAQPHEVNESMYVTDIDLTNRVFEVSAKDIASDEFLLWFEKFMTISQVSSDWDTSTVKNAHPDYIDSQTNLQWFDSIEHWEETGELDDYLLSHSIIESQVIKRILKNSNIVFLTEQQKNQWDIFYHRCSGPDWPASIGDEYQYYDLPDWVQKEIQDFGYKLNVPGKPNPIIKNLDWENLSLEEINQVYQHTKTS